MPNGWISACLDDVVSLHRGYDLPANTRNEGTIPVMGSFGVTGYHDTWKVRGPGVTVGRSGASFGVVSRVSVPYWPLNTCLYVDDFKGNDPDWVFHMLSQIDLKRFNSGSAQPSLNRNYIKHIPVEVPSLDEQRRISRAVRAFDALIDTNETTVRKLLDLAKLVYVRESRDAEMIRLGELYSVALGGVWGEDEATETATEAVAVFRGRDIEDVLLGKDPSPPTRFLSGKQMASRQVGLGEIWTAGSGTLGPTVPITPDFRALVGRDRISYSNFVKRLVPHCADDGWYGVAWLAMLHAWHTGAIHAFRTGTAMPNLDVHALLTSLSIPRLSMHQRDAVNRATALALDAELRHETRKLRERRDLLLPLLMSGQVRVSELEGVG